MTILLIILIIIIILLLLLFIQIKEEFTITHTHSNHPYASSHKHTNTFSNTKYIKDNAFYWDKYHNDEVKDLIVFAESATNVHKTKFNSEQLEWTPKYKKSNWLKINF